MMRIRTGGIFGDPVQFLDDKRITLVAGDDDRAMFEIYINTDGHSVEFRSVGTCKVNGVIYDSRFVIGPNAANSVTISAVEYSAK